MHVLLTLGLAWSASLTALHVRPAVYETRARTSALAAVVGRREALGAAVAFGTSTLLPTAAIAGETKTVMVAGATGQTGRRVLERLAATPGLVSVGAVRNVDKAKQSLASSSTVVRGAMLDKVGAVDTSAVRLAALDVVKDSVESMSTTLKGVDALVIAVGFVPGNPFKMDAASHAVDNVGTVALIDAAKAAGVRKVVLVSSILTDGPAWGQEKSPGYQVCAAPPAGGAQRGDAPGEEFSFLLLLFGWGMGITDNHGVGFPIHLMDARDVLSPLNARAAAVRLPEPAAVEQCLWPHSRGEAW